MKKTVTIIAGLVLLSSFSTAFAQNITLELLKSSGGSSYEYSAPIPVSSVQYSFNFPTNTTSQSTGAGAGKVELNPVSITKQLDAATAVLLKALFPGVAYEYVRLNFYKADGKLAYRIVLGTAAIGSYSAGGADGCTNGCPALFESITFGYSIIVTYDPIGNKIVGWNKIKNTAENGDGAIPMAVITK